MAMTAAELESSIKTLIDTVEGLPVPTKDPSAKMIQASGCIVIALVGEFMMDIKRIANAAERLADTTEEINARS